LFKQPFQKTFFPTVKQHKQPVQTPENIRE